MKLCTPLYYVNKNFETVIDENGVREDFKYVWANGERVAKIYENGSKVYYLNDHLGSSSVLVDENGNELERIQYYPFGAVKSGAVEKYGYNSKELDDTGLLYYGARYYNPQLRRWTQPDSITLNVYDPQSLSPYAYVSNNPLRYVDFHGNTRVEANYWGEKYGWQLKIIKEGPGFSSKDYISIERGVVKNLVITRNFLDGKYQSGDIDFQVEMEDGTLRLLSDINAEAYEDLKMELSEVFTSSIQFGKWMEAGGKAIQELGTYAEWGDRGKTAIAFTKGEDTAFKDTLELVPVLGAFYGVARHGSNALYTDTASIAELFNKYYGDVLIIDTHVYTYDKRKKEYKFTQFRGYGSEALRHMGGAYDGGGDENN